LMNKTSIFGNIYITFFSVK